MSVINMDDYRKQKTDFKEQIRLAEQQLFYNRNKRISYNMQLLCCDDKEKGRILKDKIASIDASNIQLNEMIRELKEGELC